MTDGGEEMRCTDEKLFQLCEDFDKHVDEHKAFVDRFEKHEARETATFGRILEAQQNNTIAIGELTGQVASLVTETRASVQLTRDIEGVARVGSGVQRFILWCLKWGGIIGAIGIALSWVVEHFSKH